MLSRRSLIAGLAMGPVLALAGPGRLALARRPAVYEPPHASKSLTAGVPFGKMQIVGKNFTDRFARWDALEDVKLGCYPDKTQCVQDKNNCPALYQFRDKTLFWQSKMAIDTDGATSAAVQGSTHDNLTSLKFATGEGIDADVVPYFVIPTFDDQQMKKDCKRAFEGSGESFRDTFQLTWGTLGVVLFGAQRCGAIFADEGPPMKIGEASVKVHSQVRKPPAPWKDAAHTSLVSASEEKNVLYFVFQGEIFNVDDFGVTKQVEMAEAIQKRALAIFEQRYPVPAPVHPSARSRRQPRKRS